MVCCVMVYLLIWYQLNYMSDKKHWPYKFISLINVFVYRIFGDVVAYSSVMLGAVCFFVVGGSFSFVCLFVLIVESCRDCSMMHRFFKQYSLNLNLGIAYVAWCYFVIDWFRQLIHFISLIVALEFHGHLIAFLQLKQAKLSKLLLTLQISISVYI